MSVIAMKDLLQHAYTRHYAVAAFDISSLDVAEGIIQAAERCSSPVVLNLNANVISDAKMVLLLPSLETAARKSSVPVAIQRNYVGHLNALTLAINNGCHSILLASDKNNDIENLIQVAHSCGVPVEALSGEIADIDFLQISMDSVLDPVFSSDTHSIPVTVNLDSAISVEQGQAITAKGVARINFGSILEKGISVQALGQSDGDQQDYQVFTNKLIELVSSEAEACIKICRSSDQADTIFDDCASWLPVEHLIIFNTNGQTESEAQAMLAEGRKSLSQIPGVRKVITGTAVKEDAKYRYTWLIRFCDQAVIDSYREHPSHVAFADNLFRPVAGDRISIDYIWSHGVGEYGAGES